MIQDRKSKGKAKQTPASKPEGKGDEVLSLNPFGIDAQAEAQEDQDVRYVVYLSCVSSILFSW